MEVLADRFEVDRLVGSGGMGDVFRARDRLTGGVVALKILHASSRDAERFRREGQILAELSHPRIVRYVAHGVATRFGADRPFLAMEWLDGEDLADRLARGPLSVYETLALGRRVAEGLAVLHERGIVHRDVKPSNLFLVGREAEQVKLLDFGVARVLNAPRPSTRSGIMVGTPGYMAPEQARGAREIDARADVFSLGALLYECVTGKPVFAGDNIAALLAKILLEKPVSLRDAGYDVPAELDALLARMLAKPVSGRPMDAAAVLNELERVPDVDDRPARHASEPQVRSLTGSERRLVTVVMASPASDGGAAPAVERDEPLSTAETVVAAFDPVTIVAGFGADAELLADGSVVVTLTRKGNAGDLAALAARCALALRPQLVGARFAIATGLATVTGKSCIGDVIERAAGTLQAAAARAAGKSEETLHGQAPIFLDETTAGLLDMSFDVGGDDRGLFIRGLRERETRSRTLLGKPTPFVGRDRELGTLVALFEECVDEPVARVVLVTGQAGAGKSRVASELVRHLSKEQGLETWMARGDAMSEGAPFSLLARLLRRAAGVGGGEPPLVRQQKLRARVSRHVPEDDRARVTEFMGELANVPFPDAQSVQLRAARHDAMLMGDQMRRAFCDLVLAETGSGPLVVILEDLHWGDLPSVSFLDSALRAASDRPFLVVGIARPEVHDTFPRLWEERGVQEVRLGALGRKAAERLVRDVLGDEVPAADLGRLLERAAGNVFYLEELVRAYAESSGRVLTAREGTGSTLVTGTTMPPPPPSSVEVPTWSMPGTVLAMLEARLERLDPMARRVLRAASIFGEVFWRGGVVALTGGDFEAREVGDWLVTLTSLEIVQRREVSRFTNEHEYQFRHALVREAAYQMLTADDRELGHRLAGEWLEGAGSPEQMMLAEHFERGGVLDKAAAYFAMGAQQALEGDDFAAARARAARAMEVGVTGETRGRLELVLAEASRWAGDHEPALASARAAMEALPHGGSEWYVAAAELVEAALTLDHLAEAEQVARRVRELAPSPQEEPAVAVARVVATSRIAVRLLVTGAVEVADAMFERLERDARDTDDVRGEPAARGFLLAARFARASWAGDIEPAARFAEEAVACFDMVGDVRNAARQRDNAGFALVLLGSFGPAEVALKQAIVSAERLGLLSVLNEAKLHLGQLYNRMLRRDDAVRVLSDVIQGFAAQNDRVGEGRGRAYLAGLLHLGRDHAGATREAEHALPYLESVPPYRAATLGLLALMRADGGDSEGAHAAGMEAMRLLRECGGAIEGEAIVYIGHAEGLRANGDIEGSRAAIGAARDRLLSRAARISDPELRRGFLEHLREHQRILLRAGEWLA